MYESLLSFVLQKSLSIHSISLQKDAVQISYTKCICN